VGAIKVDAHELFCLLTLSRGCFNPAYKPSKFKASRMVEQYLHILHRVSRKHQEKIKGNVFNNLLYKQE